MIDFPNAPTSGQIFNAAGCSWKWDGTKWVPIMGSGPFLPIAGGTMTGPITLPGNPTTALQAATKQYIDAGFLPLSGGTVTGPITLAGNPTAALQAAPKQYIDAGFLPLTGGTVTGAITLPGSPTAALQAASKQYVDTAALPISGGTVNGNLAVTGSMQVNGTLTSNAAIFSQPGPSSAFLFYDRTTNQQNMWYATGGVTRLNIAAGEYFTINESNGNATFGAGLQVNNGLVVAGGNASFAGALTTSSTLTVNAGGANITGSVAIAGYVSSTGASSGFNFSDRSTGQQCWWYAVGGLARLLVAAGEYFNINESNGNATFGGALQINNGLNVYNGLTVYNGSIVANSGGLSVTGNINGLDVGVRNATMTGNVSCGACQVTGALQVSGGGTAIYASSGNIYSVGTVFGSALQTTAGGTALYVPGANASIGAQLNVGGDCYAANFYPTSDEITKANIEPVSVDCLAAIRGLQLISYDREEHHVDVGVTAQDVRDHLPNAVVENPFQDGLLAIDLLALVSYLTGAVQQLSARIERLEGTAS